MFSRAALFLALAAAAAAELLIREAGVGGKVGPVLAPGATFCPSAYSAAGFSIECKGITGPVTFFVDGSPVRTESTLPYTIAGSTAGNIAAWTGYPPGGFAVECRNAAGAAESINVRLTCASVARAPLTAAAALASPVLQVAPSPPPLSMAKGNSCVRIKGDMSMGLGNGWTADNTSIWYKRGSVDAAVTPAGVDSVDFMFLAPATGTFGVSVDMTTSGGKQVWMKFRYGFSLKRAATTTSAASTIQSGEEDYIQVYHNVNGRSAESFAVVGDPHAISLGSPLRAGLQYKLTVGGRNADVQVHSVILFPCSGADCVPTSTVWKNLVEQCK